MSEKTVSLDVETNSQKNNMLALRLTLVGSSAAPLLLEMPPAISFGIVGVNAGALRETFEIRTLEDRGSSPWIARLAPSSRAIGVKLVRIHDAETRENTIMRTYNYDIFLDTKLATPGEFSDALVAYGDLKDEHALANIPVHAHIRQYVYATPSRVYLVRDAADHVASGTLILSCIDPDFPLECYCNDHDPGIEISLLKRSHSRLIYRIIAHSDASIASPISLIFQTNHPGTPQVLVASELRCYQEGSSR